jgi:hypothetical protein
LFTVGGCAHKIIPRNYTTYKPSFTPCNVVIKKHLKDTTGLIKVGSIRLKDSGYSINCNEEDAVNILKKEACRLNADLVNIFRDKNPGFLYYCYDCHADFFRFKNKASDSVRFANVKGDSVRYKVPKEIYHPVTRFSFGGGPSYWFTTPDKSLPSFLQKYNNELNYGSNLDADVSYYFNHRFGIGLNYNSFNTSNVLENINRTLPNGTIEYGRLVDNISIQYFGPSFNQRVISLNKKHVIITRLSIGYLLSNNNAIAFTPYTIKSSTLGVMESVGYDYAILPNMAIGVQINFILGNSSSYDLTEFGQTRSLVLENTRRISFTHLDLSVGLRYNLFK